ncbi:MAG TPA: ABC transporter permease [Candidatus Limnocylindrales bacterium]|nr:ABC transporter permease [Candidatus Limnocylindrales bacterium]
MDLVSAVVSWFADPTHWSGTSGVPARLAQHIGISLLSVAIAAAIALPLGLYIGHTRRGQAVAINLANVGRAIPSLAAIAIVVPFSQMVGTGLEYFNLYPTIIAMVVLAIPPILVNTYAGVAEVDRDLVESARGMGMTERQILRRVEIPVALPVIVGGFRSASVQVIATATLGAIYGLGALGGYIVEGVAQQDNGRLFAGVVLVALLALGAEGGLSWLQRRLTGARNP